MSTSAAPTYDTSLVIDYPARDMTITVKAEMPCNLLQQILQQEGQTLPIDAASEQTTVGELVLHDHCGPRQFGYGTLRDYVIGVAAVDGFERVFHAGGRVVKNVAGYDLCRLLTGSRGLLGQLQHVTFKVRPLPTTQKLLIAGFRNLHNLEQALARLNTTATTPIILDVVGRHSIPDLLCSNSLLPDPAAPILDSSAVLLLGFDGPENACQWQIATVIDELSDLPTWTNSQLPPNALQQWLLTAQKHSFPTQTPAWLASVTIPPSQVCAIIDAMNQQQCCVFGRAGNGRLWCWPAPADEGPSATDEQKGITALHQLTADGPGSVHVLHAESATSTPRSAAVRTYSSRLQQAFGTT
jgi:glycolate oxidase FAD binding subunit